MKKAIGILFLFVITINLFAQSDTVYEYSFGGIQNDNCNQIRTTSDGGYIMVGTTNSFGHGANDFYVIKVDSLFHHQWSTALGGPSSDEGYSVTPTLDKGYAFVGYSYVNSTNGYDVLMIKTDSKGNVQWQKTYGGSDWDFGYSIQQTLDSGYVICGQTYSYGSGNGDVYVIRTDKLGDTLWTKAIGGTGYDIGNAVHVVNDSLYYIAGTTTSGLSVGDTNIYFIKINNNGLIEKDTTFGASAQSINVGHSIEGALNNGLIISGYANIRNRSYSSPLFIMLDSSGKMQKFDSIYYPGEEYSNDAMQCPDRTFISAGASNIPGYGEFDLIAMRLYQPPLYFWWAAPSEGGKGEDIGTSCAISKNSNAVFAGCSNSTDSSVGFPKLSIGLYDVFVCRFKNCDSIIQDNKLYHKITRFQDTLPPLAIDEQAPPTLMVKVFPNPVATDATIVVQGELADKYWVNLYDMNGKSIMEGKEMTKLGHGQVIFHLVKGNLQSGIYLFKVFDKNNNSANGKIIIE